MPFVHGGGGGDETGLPHRALNESLGTDILVSDYTLRLMGNAFLTHPVDAIRTGSRARPSRFTP